MRKGKKGTCRPVLRELTPSVSDATIAMTLHDLGSVRWAEFHVDQMVLGVLVEVAPVDPETGQLGVADTAYVSAIIPGSPLVIDLSEFEGFSVSVEGERALFSTIVRDLDAYWQAQHDAGILRHRPQEVPLPSADALAGLTQAVRGLTQATSSGLRTVAHPLRKVAATTEKDAEADEQKVAAAVIAEVREPSASGPVPRMVDDAGRLSGPGEVVEGAYVWSPAPPGVWTALVVVDLDASEGGSLTELRAPITVPDDRETFVTIRLAQDQPDE